MTAAAAEAIYGVVLRDGAIDRRRAARGAARSCVAARPRVRLTPVADLDTERGRAIRLDADTAARLGVGAGAVVELVNRSGAPLRAWVTARDARAMATSPRSRPSCCACWRCPTAARSTSAPCHSGALGQLRPITRREELRPSTEDRSTTDMPKIWRVYSGADGQSHIAEEAARDEALHRHRGRLRRGRARPRRRRASRSASRRRATCSTGTARRGGNTRSRSPGWRRSRSATARWPASGPATSCWPRT